MKAALLFLIAAALEAHTSHASNFVCPDAKLYANDNAFAAVGENGNITSWGMGRSARFGITNFSKPIDFIVPSWNGFTAISKDRLSAFAWGGDARKQTRQVEFNFGKEVKKLAAGYDMFAALLEDGTVETWGSPRDGGNSSSVKNELVGIQDIHATCCGFLAITANNTLVYWGDGSMPEELKNVPVRKVHDSPYLFLVEKMDSSVVCAHVSSTFNCDGVKFKSGIRFVVENRAAFAAVQLDGSVVSWGFSSSGGDSSTVSFSGSITHLMSTEDAFAALNSDGMVFAWGRKSAGGELPASMANVECQNLFSTLRAFACLEKNQTIVTWGDEDFGGKFVDLATTFVTVVSTTEAFAALTSDGSVVCWGNNAFGGDCSQVTFNSPVAHLIATKESFAAVQIDGAIVSWGEFYSGGEMNGIRQAGRVQSVHFTSYLSAVVMSNKETVVLGVSHDNIGLQYVQNTSKVVSNDYSMMALKKDGTLIAWDRIESFDLEKVNSGPPVKALVSGQTSFAAINSNGTIFGWRLVTDRAKKFQRGVDPPSKAVSLTGGSQSFAAILEDKTVFCFGQEFSGGSCTTVADQLQEISVIYSNDFAFAAVRTNGTVVTWGYSLYGAKSDDVDFSSGVNTIVSTRKAFAATLNDGRVVAWGLDVDGGLLPFPLKDVSVLVSTESAFAALQSNGTVVSWGQASRGGDSKSLDLTRVEDLMSNNQDFAVVREDGTAISWPRVLEFTDVKQLVPGRSSFLALRKDGSLVYGAKADLGNYEYFQPTSPSRTGIYHAGANNFIIELEGGHWDTFGYLPTIDELHPVVMCSEKPSVSPTKIPTLAPIAPTYSPTNATSPPSSEPLSTGATVAIVVSASVVLLGVAGVAIWKFRASRRNGSALQSTFSTKT